MGYREIGSGGQTLVCARWRPGSHGVGISRAQRAYRHPQGRSSCPRRHRVVSMTEVLQYVFNGVITGSVYALVGVGLTLGIGVARFFNFAQGQLAVLAAFAGMALTQAGLPFMVALPVAIALVALLGAAIRDVVIPFAGRDSLVIFLGTLGIGYVIADITLLIWGPDHHTLISPWSGTSTIGGVVLPHPMLLLVAIAAPVIVALYLVLHQTDFGRRLRSCAEDMEMSSLLGINVPATMRAAIGIGSALAGLGGVMVASLYPFDAFAGSAFLTKGIAVALAGGLGSITGSVVCGVALGVIEAFATGYGITVGELHFGSGWRDGYAFVLMIAVLVWRPRGLFRGSGEL